MSYVFFVFSHPAFFDVKTKKDVPEQPNMIGLYTNDVPAVPVTDSDSIHVAFNIENNIGGNSSRFKVTDASFSGSDLTHALEETQGEQPQITVSLPSGEWQLQLQGNVYVLRSFVIYVSVAQLKKYVTDL